jgi:hypothetical protein
MIYFYCLKFNLQIAAKINQPGQCGAGDGISPGKRPLDADPNNFGEYSCVLTINWSKGHKTL